MPASAAEPQSGWRPCLVKHQKRPALQQGPRVACAAVWCGACLALPGGHCEPLARSLPAARTPCSLRGPRAERTGRQPDHHPRTLFSRARVPAHRFRGSGPIDGAPKAQLNARRGLGPRPGPAGGLCAGGSARVAGGGCCGALATADAFRGQHLCRGRPAALIAARFARWGRQRGTRLRGAKPAQIPQLARGCGAATRIQPPPPIARKRCFSAVAEGGAAPAWGVAGGRRGQDPDRTTRPRSRHGRPHDPQRRHAACSSSRRRLVPRRAGR